jgi:hypothetical protein
MDKCCELEGDVFEPYSCSLYKVKGAEFSYYIIQIIVNKNEYKLYVRNGKNDEFGKMKVIDCENKKDAIEQFNDQFLSKTDNEFEKTFIKKEGKYDNKFPNDLVNKSKEVSENLLNPKLIYFLNLITDEKIVENILTQLQINIARMPIAKMTMERIERGEEILKTLKKIIHEKNKSQDINDLTVEYYTRIPYNIDSGESDGKPLSNDFIIDKYMANMEIIKHIRITYDSIIKNKKKANLLNKFETIYFNLKCDIAPLNENTQVYKELEKYVAIGGLKIKHIYEVSNKAQDAIYNEYTKKIENKTLLFHGSSISNWFSILKNGFYLDPGKIGVKITGKMFGNGIYWANCISKSYNYCGMSNAGVVIIGVGEVALGQMCAPNAANYTLSQKDMDGLGTQSTHGRGRNTPGSQVVVDGIIIPNGNLTAVATTCGLNYDEFIIYNTKQYRLKYLLVL